MFMNLAVHIALAVFRFLPFTYGEPETKIGTAAYVPYVEECADILVDRPEYDVCVFEYVKG